MQATLRLAERRTRLLCQCDGDYNGGGYTASILAKLVIQFLLELQITVLITIFSTLFSISLAIFPNFGEPYI